jgi:hypothetical protein
MGARQGGTGAAGRGRDRNSGKVSDMKQFLQSTGRRNGAIVGRDRPPGGRFARFCEAWRLPAADKPPIARTCYVQ